MKSEETLTILTDCLKIIETGLGMYPLIGWSVIREGVSGLKVLEKLMRMEMNSSIEPEDTLITEQINIHLAEPASL